jgi:hypothetical protein
MSTCGGGWPQYLHVLSLMERWLKGGSLKKQSSTDAAETEGASETQASTPSSQEFQDTECNVRDTTPLLRSSITSAGSMISKRRKYCESYLSFGFTSIGDVNAPDAKSILCNKVLSNGSMFPAKLETNHPECMSKETSFFFKRKLQILTNCRSLMTKAAKTDNENAAGASCRVIYRIALTGEVHTIAETLINAM